MAIAARERTSEQDANLAEREKRLYQNFAEMQRRESQLDQLVASRADLQVRDQRQALLKDIQGKDAEIAAAREFLGWNYEPFVIPADIATEWSAKDAGAAKEAAWNEKYAAYAEAHPELAAEYKRRVNGDLPANWAEASQAFVEQLQANPSKIASRKASQNAIEAFGKLLPEFLGGSAACWLFG